MKQTIEVGYGRVCSLVCAGITVLLAGALSLFATITNVGCGHPVSDNIFFYPCDSSHGPPCSKDTDSCSMEWLPAGVCWGGCEGTYVDAYYYLTDDNWSGNTTNQKGECQVNCSCVLKTPPFEDHASGTVSYFGDLCGG